jgi:hypothetical protein
MKQIEILCHVQRYAATGIIDDSLIPCYDQDGHWRGGSLRKADSAQHSALMIYWASS